MDGLTLFGLFAVTAMLLSYALEDRSHWFVLAFAAACALGSVYGFLQGAWPFGLVEAIWAVGALRRWMVSTPVASRRSGSDTATPMVLVPKSSPTSAPRSGQCATASISGRMRAGMTSHTTLAVTRAKRQRQISVDKRLIMDGLTLFGLFAVTAMLVSYALEDRSPWFILAFAVACALGSIYGFLQGAWPFGLVEAIWAVVALRRWIARQRRVA